MIKLTDPTVGKAELDAVKRVFDSGHLAEGPVTERFEKEVARIAGVEHAVAVCNCTVALELALRAFWVQDRVVTSAFGHPATRRAIINAGCTPVFCDVSLETYNMTRGYEDSLGNMIGGFIPVSWGGNPEYSCPPTEKPVIEDAACSLGSSSKSFFHRDADAFCYSFHPRKLVTAGEGGAIASNDLSLIKTVKSMKNFELGNYKFDDVRAAIGLVQLKRLPQLIHMRRIMAKTYSELLYNANIGVVPPKNSTGHIFQTYAVLLPEHSDRNRIIVNLKKQGIEVQVGAYFLPQTGDESLMNLKNSKLLAERLLALPMSYDLSLSDQETVVEALVRELS